MSYLSHLAMNGLLTSSTSYGAHGHAIIARQLLLLKADVLAQVKDIQPDVEPLDDVECFLVKLGTHQAASVIASHDYSCSLDSAAHMLWLSEPYGEREFPLNPDEEEYSRLQNLISEQMDSTDEIDWLPSEIGHRDAIFNTSLKPQSKQESVDREAAITATVVAPTFRMTRGRAARIAANANQHQHNVLQYEAPRALIGVS